MCVCRDLKRNTEGKKIPILTIGKRSERFDQNSWQYRCLVRKSLLMIADVI